MIQLESVHVISHIQQQKELRNENKKKLKVKRRKKRNKTDDFPHERNEKKKNTPRFLTTIKKIAYGRNVVNEWMNKYVYIGK